MDTEHASQLAAMIEAGNEALSRAAWEEARSKFEHSLRVNESPEALEGLGAAAWWLEDDAVAIEARKRAYRLYRDRGDRRGAARVIATGLAMDYVFRGEYAVANGWIQRAHRLLEGIEQCPEAGWLAIVEAHLALRVEHDPVTAREISAKGVALGRALGVVDLEMLALAYEGFALVDQGETFVGMRCLDESTAAAIGGDMSHIHAIATTYCCLIFACERVRDFHRAAQWCEKLREFCDRWSYRMMFSICRTHYASTLIWRGAWSEAEAELEESILALEATRPAQAADGFVRLADLRRRQGRFDEAALLLEQADSHPFRMLAGHLAFLGRAANALAQNDAATAAELGERFLRAISEEDRMERAAGLELLVQARLVLEDHAGADEALTEFRSITSGVTTNALTGSVRFTEGLFAAATGDPKSAKECFEDAMYLFDRCGAPFETARARLELARCLLALRRPDAAELQALDALESLQTLGAAAEQGHAAALLREIETATHPESAEALGRTRLSRREVEVLRLAAQGLSNQEIASRLILSRHTVHRHISNILTKLDLPSRAAAATYAAQNGLL